MKNNSLNQMITGEIENLAENLNTVNKKSTDTILQELISNIGKIDFEVLAFPDIENTKSEIEKLKPLVYNDDGSLNNENKKDYERYKALLKKTQGCKLTRNHYLIICVEQILKIATENNWGLCKKHGFVYLYNGSYWQELDKEQFQHFLGNAALKMGVEKFKGKIHTFKEDLFKQFMAEAYLPTPENVSNSILINLINGTFDITHLKKHLRPFDRIDFITHQLPFEYDPEAKAPMFQKYLDEVLPDKDKQKVFAEYCGYIFIRPRILKLEKMLILYGTGANGKSVFFEVLNALLGSENLCNYSLQSLTNDNGYYRAKLANKLVNYASEINGKLETDIFKQLASGEPIEARLPYGQPIILTEYAKMIFNCNELPKDVEHTNAYFRRFLIIGFDITIPEDRQDAQLANKIIEHELSGVFNWILQGLDNLLSQKRFSASSAVDGARKEYEAQSDSVKMFIDEYGYKTSTNHTLITELYQRYKNFCIEDGYRPVGKSNFMKRLKHYGFVIQRINIGNIAYISNGNI